MFTLSLTEHDASQVEIAIGHMIESRERDMSFAKPGSDFHARASRRHLEAVQLRAVVQNALYGNVEDPA